MSDGVSGAIEREFPGDPAAPSAARRFATTALDELLPAPVPRELCEDLELVVSELVTNAVRAGSPRVHVTIENTGEHIALRVGDDATGWPEPRDAGIHDVNGRGLALVSAICSSWGVRLAETRKVVWAELTIPR